MRSGASLKRHASGGAYHPISARRARDTDFVTARDFHTQKVQASLAERFSAVVLPFGCKHLSRIAGCSPETAKAWRAGRQMAQAEHVFRLALQIPSVRAFVESEIGSGRILDDPQVLDEITRRVSQQIRERT